jgi:hypothetical protein
MWNYRNLKSNVFFNSRPGVGKTCSLHQTCSHSTVFFSVWDIDLGFFASCRYWPNLACQVGPGPVICQGWPGEPAKKFRCSLFISALEELQTPNICQWNKCLMGRPARGWNLKISARAAGKIILEAVKIKLSWNLTKVFYTWSTILKKYNLEGKFYLSIYKFSFLYFLSNFVKKKLPFSIFWKRKI